MNLEGEEGRLTAVLALNLLDTAPEPEFTELVELAAELCASPVSTISLLDAHRQWHKASVGLEVRELPRKESVCQYTVQGKGLLIIEDLLEDERFRERVYAGPEGRMRFYAGVPLSSGEQQVGTLCVMDTVPRTLSPGQRRGLASLGRQVQLRLEQRGKQVLLERLAEEKDVLTRTLEAKNKLFGAFMDHGPFVSYIKDGEGRMVFYNKGMRDNFGVEGDAWLGKADHELWPEEIASKFRQHDLQVMAGGVPVMLEEHSPGPGGQTLTWRSYKFPLMDERETTLLAGISVDVTEEKERKAQLEAALQESQALSASLVHSHAMMRTMLENNPSQCYLKSEDGRYLFYNRKFAEHFGISPEKWLGKTDHDLVPRELAEELRRNDLLALNSDEVLETMGDPSGMKGDGPTFKVLKFRCVDQDGSKMLAGIAIDVTGDLEREKELKRAFDALEAIASVDGLTGLANRRAFDARLEVEFTRAEAALRPLSLLILDVDNFKLRNDRFGHSAGDDALRMVGLALQQCCRRKGDMAARVGGEEFAFLLPETECIEAEQLAERVLQAVRQVSAGVVPITVSVGVASLNATTRTAARLFTRADDAMYAAKRMGKNRAVVHSVHLNTLLQGVVEDLSRKELSSMDLRELAGPRSALWA